MSRLINILVIVSLIAMALAACAPTELPSICYQYNFALDPSNSAGDPINVSAGEILEGIGLQTVGGELVVNWSETFFIEWIVIEVVVARPEGVEGDIDLAFVADAFGIELSQAGTFPSDEDVLNLYFEHAGAAEISKNFNAILQSSQPIIVGSMTVYLNGANPFPRNDCAPTTPTVGPATDTPTATETSSTPSPTPSCTNTEYAYQNTDYPTHYSGDFYFFNTAGIVLNGGGDTGDWIRPAEVDSYVTDIDFKMTRSSVQVYSSLTIEVNSIQFEVNPQPWAAGHGEINAVHIVLSDWGFEPQNVSEVTFTAGNSHPDGSVAIRGVTIRVCDVPTSTPTNTPSPTPTSTPLGIGSSTPTNTGIGVSTRTPTITLTPSDTGEPPPPSVTPIPPTAIPSWTPPPSVTPMDTPTGIPLPTEVEGTVTPWGTYPGADLTGLPGTPVFGDVTTPIVGTLAGTPTVIKTPLEVPDDLEDTHPDIEQGLGTAAAYVNTLPDDFSLMYPRLGNVEEAAGYARYLVSGASCQEIFGQRLCPIPLHIAYGFFVMIFVSTVMIVFRFALWFFRFVIWVIRFILKIIPFIG